MTVSQKCTLVNVMERPPVPEKARGWESCCTALIIKLLFFCSLKGKRRAAELDIYRLISWSDHSLHMNSFHFLLCFKFPYASQTDSVGLMAGITFTTRVCFYGAGVLKEFIHPKMAIVNLLNSFFMPLGFGLVAGRDQGLLYGVCERQMGGGRIN